MRFSLRTRLVALATALLAGTSAPLQALAHGEVHEHLSRAHGAAHEDAHAAAHKDAHEAAHDDAHPVAHRAGDGDEHAPTTPGASGHTRTVSNERGTVSTPRDSHGHQHATLAAVVGPRDATRVASSVATPAILPNPIAVIGDRTCSTVAPCEERALLARPGPEYQLPPAPRGPPLS